MKNITKSIIVCCAIAVIGASIGIAIHSLKKQPYDENETISGKSYTNEELEESTKIKKQLEIINQKVQNDISIPENVTEGEKENLEKQKTYLSVLKVIKNIQKIYCPKLQSYMDMDSEILSINKILRDRDNLLVLADTVVKDGDIFFNKQVYYEIYVGNDTVANSKTVEELVNQLNESTDVSMRELHMIFSKDDEFCSNIFKNYAINEPTIADYLANGYEAKLLNSGLINPYAAQYSNKCVLEIELNNGENNWVAIIEISYHRAQKEFGYEEFREKVKNPDPNVEIMFKSFGMCENLGVDFNDVINQIFEQ
ncbi:MAG: hypothetical protein SOX04_03620 [Eubacteriales bacterium]|nr:hypothetical protein [Christensenellaceae bacterium]MDY3241619.1 hypothetical protein [Eubacteriales bacterium]